MSALSAPAGSDNGSGASRGSEPKHHARRRQHRRREQPRSVNWPTTFGRLAMLHWHTHHSHLTNPLISLVYRDDVRAVKNAPQLRPQIARAKLQALVEGAQRASERP